jgi:hypothetical protein
MGKKVYAWHFVGKTLRDGRPVPPNGVKLIHGRAPSICNHGFHASKSPFDALQYAPGNTLCLVEMSGEMDFQSDKMVATERIIIHRIDSTELLRKFARQCALNVIHLWNPPAVVVEYLKTGNESLRADARAATRAAAGDAAGAAWAAARDAAGDARAAARAAAGDAAGAAGAAWAAAGDAAGAAAGAAWAAARDAWDAARDAWDAEKQKQNEQFTELVNTEFKEFLDNLN